MQNLKKSKKSKKIDLKISYNEFHISREIRKLCKISDSLFSSFGNVIIRDLKTIQKFTINLNKVFVAQGKPESQVSAGSINAMGLLDEVSHIISMLFRRHRAPNSFKEALENLDKKFGREEIDKLLLDFMENFPPTEVYKGECSANEFLKRKALDIGTNLQRSNREATLEEMILLHLANENPAFKPFNILFDDTALKVSSIYNDAWKEIQTFFKSQPTFGPFGNNLISMLREPMIYSPNDLKGQLEYVRNHWAEFFKEIMDLLTLLLGSMDMLSEEQKAKWQPMNLNGALPDMQPYSYENLMNEYENFTADKDWMPKVILMAKTVLVWLYQLTQKYGRPINTLDQIPDEELDALAQEGFTGLWLIGLWERSNASKRIKQICGNPEAAASAYSLYDYEIAQNIGGWSAVENLRARLWKRGIRLASDMVPNHTGMDSRWVIEKPDLFIQRRDNPFPQYTYNGENLSHDGRVSIYLEDHYYSKNDCSVVFKRVDNATGDTRYIYHGNDGTGMPWNDTAQIDFLNPQAREEVIQEILHVAKNFPIIRFDAAMVLAKKHIRRLWYPEPGHGGDIATRSQTQLTTKQFEDAIPNEFWREVVDRVAVEAPDTLLLAEAFWMLEGYFVRTLGMHRVYNSAFMNMLKKEENQKYKDSVKNTLNFDPQVLKRYVNFMNNPDEESAVAQFGRGDKYFGVCTLMVTMPGLPMFGHGQLEGFEEKYGMEYTRAYRNETPDQGLFERHKWQIFPLMKKRYLYAGVEDFLLYDVWDNGHVNENVFAYSNACGGEKSIVLYNNSYQRAQGTIHTSATYGVKDESSGEMKLVTRTLGQGIYATDSDSHFIIFKNLNSGLWFIRRSSEICRNGLFIILNGYETQVLQEIYEVADDETGKWSKLCNHLAGSGVENMEIAWMEWEYAELYKALTEFLSAENLQMLKKFLKTDEPATKTKKSAKSKTISEKVIEDSENETEEKPLTAKDLEEFLEKLEPNAKEFYKLAAIFAHKEEEVTKSKEKDSEKSEKFDEEILAKKDFEEFSENLKQIVELSKVANTKAKSKKFVPTDLKKLIKETSDCLLAFAILKALGSTCANGNADKWMLTRKVFAQLNSAQISVEYIWQNFEWFVKLESVFAELSKETDSKKAKILAGNIVKMLFTGKNAGFLCGANEFGGTVWFNKERTEATFKTLRLIGSFELYLSTKTDEEKFAEKKKTSETILKEIENVASKAEYKVENIIEKYFPKPKKAKVTTKKLTKSKTVKKVDPDKTEK